MRPRASISERDLHDRLSRRRGDVLHRRFFPVSIFEMFRMSLTSAVRCSALRRIGLHVVDPVAGAGGIEQQIGEADDSCHGRADLVAHVGEEGGLRAARVEAVAPRAAFSSAACRCSIFALVRALRHGVSMRSLDQQKGRVRGDHDRKPITSLYAGHEQARGDRDEARSRRVLQQAEVSRQRRSTSRR